MRTPITRRARIALTAGLTTLIVLAGTTTSFALWTATASLGSTSSAATVGVSHALTGSTLGVTYSSQVPTTTAVGVITVTNSSSRAGTYSLALSSTSASATLRSAVNVEIGTAAACTNSAVLTNVTSGTFAATVTKTAAIAANTAVALCVRTSMTAASIDANPSASLAATAASSVAIGSWSATAAPAITFTQSTAAAPVVQTLNTSAWYQIKNDDGARCVEGLDYGNTTGSSVVTSMCAVQSAFSSNANEYWRFTATDSGYYRIIYRHAPTLVLGSIAASSGSGVVVSSASTNNQQWLPVSNTDGTFTFKLRASPTLCLQHQGNNGSNKPVSVATCVTGQLTQRFMVTMYNTVQPAPITLTCDATGGFNANYSWPQLAGYQSEVVYRVLLNNVVDTVHTGGTGSYTVAQFDWTPTTAAYPVGTYALEVQQSVASGAWTRVGTAVLRVSATNPRLSCS